MADEPAAPVGRAVGRGVTRVPGHGAALVPPEGGHVADGILLRRPQARVRVPVYLAAALPLELVLAFALERRHARHRRVRRLAAQVAQGPVARVIEAVVPDDAALDPAVLGADVASSGGGAVGPAGLDARDRRQRARPEGATALPPVKHVDHLHRWSW